MRAATITPIPGPALFGPEGYSDSQLAALTVMLDGEQRTWRNPGLTTAETAAVAAWATTALDDEHRYRRLMRADLVVLRRG